MRSNGDEVEVDSSYHDDNNDWGDGQHNHHNEVVVYTMYFKKTRNLKSKAKFVFVIT